MASAPSTVFDTYRWFLLDEVVTSCRFKRGSESEKMVLLPGVPERKFRTEVLHPHEWAGGSGYALACKEAAVRSQRHVRRASGCPDRPCSVIICRLLGSVISPELLVAVNLRDSR